MDAVNMRHEKAGNYDNLLTEVLSAKALLSCGIKKSPGNNPGLLAFG